MMKNPIASVVFALALTGCQTQGNQALQEPAKTSGTPYAITQADRQAIARDVSAQLRDPDSAIFGELKAVRQHNGIIEVCGYVNGRNAFGGYTGFVPYSGLLTFNKNGLLVFATYGIGDTPSDHASTAILMTCQASGIL